MQKKVVRILWIDIAKAYGIILVFYGHFVERLSGLGYDAAFIQLKFIYSFHMPLFFIICGYVYKKNNSSFSGFLKYHLASRILPVIFFNIWGLSFEIAQDFFNHSLNIRSYLVNLLGLLRGYPAFNIVTWFLICLFIVEIIHWFLGRYVNTFKKVLIYGILFFMFDWLISANKAQSFTSTREITKDFWFIYQALGAYWFYRLGTYLKNWGYLSKELPLRLKFKDLFLSLFVVLFTFNLNAGPFNYELGVVIMALSSYGNPLLFPITAVAGSLFIIFLAKLTPSNKAILFIGQNSLILLGLNGLFHHFANQRLAIWINKFLASSSLSVFIVCSFVTFVSLSVCIPCIVILNKFIPQLVGKPKTNGPFLKNLV